MFSHAILSFVCRKGANCALQNEMFNQYDVTHAFVKTNAHVLMPWQAFGKLSMYWMLPIQTTASSNRGPCLLLCKINLGF